MPGGAFTEAEAGVNQNGGEWYWCGWRRATNRTHTG